MTRAWMPGVTEPRCVGRCLILDEVATRVNQGSNVRCPAAAEPGFDMCLVHLQNDGKLIEGFPGQVELDE